MSQSNTKKKRVVVCNCFYVFVFFMFVWFVFCTLLRFFCFDLFLFCFCFVLFFDCFVGFGEIQKWKVLIRCEKEKCHAKKKNKNQGLS